VKEGRRRGKADWETWRIYATRSTPDKGKTWEQKAEFFAIKIEK